jgi:RND family efflux transporter MFP subunit
MKRVRRSITWSFAVVAALAASEGCSPPKPPLAETPPATVSVAKPITDRKVRDVQEFIATLAAAESIEVRAQVTGYLKKIEFEAGKPVKKGDVLFVIDKRVFDAAVRQASGQVEIYKAQLTQAQKSLARTLKIQGSTQEEREQGQAQVEVYRAQMDAAQAQLDDAKINLDFCDVKADIDGIVDRNLITIGNLVTANQTLLTTIVKPYPLYAYFDVDQQSVQRYIEINRPEMVKAKAKKLELNIPVDFDLKPDGDAFPYNGTIDYVRTQLNASTGAQQVRAVFTQKDLKEGQEPLQPGYTGRIRVSVSPPFSPILIPDLAIGVDQGQKFVYIVNDDNKVEYRKITIGNMYADNLRAITAGLKGDERVIVNGLQRVRPGGTVDPQRVDPITLQPLTQANGERVQIR